MSRSKSTHFLIVTYPSWAHVRTLLALTASLLNLNPDLYVTVLIPAKRSKAVSLELEQYNIDFTRYRAIHYGDDEQKEVGGMWNPRGGFRDECMGQLEGFVDPIAKLETIVDPVTGQSVTPFDIPFSLIITDITLMMWSFDVKQKIIDLTGKQVAVLGSCPYNTAFLGVILTLSSQFMQRVQAIVAGGGGDKEKTQELTAEMITNNTDIIDVLPLWPMHLHETIPVSKETLLQYAPRVAGMVKVMMSKVDGIIIAWPHVLGECLQQQLEKDWGQIYQIGPQLPVVKDEWSVESKKGECKAYLDNCARQSVIYISFGSVLYAPVYDQIRILIDVLEEVGAKYIMAEGNAPPEVKEMMRNRIGKGKDKGLLVAWAPQRAILSHPSTGVFLTHGGSNSALEAIAFKVPMVQWPAGFDQPAIANELDKLGVAKELIQIRDGYNIGKPIARDGTLVHGTEDALRVELLGLFSDLDNDVFRSLRAKVSEISELVSSDREQGDSMKAVRKLAMMGC